MNATVKFGFDTTKHSIKIDNLPDLAPLPYVAIVADSSDLINDNWLYPKTIH